MNRLTDEQIVLRLETPARTPLPEAFLRWQIESRRALLEAIAAGGNPRRFAAHLPVMITFTADGPFPVHTATKGAGITPRDEVLDHYIGLLEHALARCESRPWEETLPERVTAVRALLDRPEEIEPRRLGFLEIFQGRTFANLQRDPRVVLHFTGDGPDYPSFQINGYAEIVGPDDPRCRYIALTRRIFEEAPFHLQQPSYVAAYLVWADEAIDKTPYVIPASSSSRFTIQPSAGSGQAPARLTSHPLASFGSAQDRCPAQEASRGDVTFREIAVAVDNSKYSEWAIATAMQIAGWFQSTIVGNHVYAARLHDQRFRDMEAGLPEEYQEPTILSHQRTMHNTLIEKGLELISASYLELLEQRCRAAGLTFVGKTPEGKNYTQLVSDIEASRYDLVVMGVRGLGEIRRQGQKHDQIVGSVCERVARRVTRDVLVTRDDRLLGGTFVVGIDGSARAFAALRIALALAVRCNARVQAVAAYDPFLHKTVFHELEGTLTTEAKQVFNAEQQKKLHDELIDSGIAKIYGDHLETARRMAAELGTEIETHLLTGKPYAAVLRHVDAQRVQPTLLVLGRTGIHVDDGLDIGANAENLLRLAPCHVLLVGRTLTPTLRQAQGKQWAETRQVSEGHLAWTPQAVARLERVPDFARGMARKAIEGYARQQGLAVVDEQLVQEARQRFGM